MLSQRCLSISRSYLPQVVAYIASLVAVLLRDFVESVVVIAIMNVYI